MLNNKWAWLLITLLLSCALWMTSRTAYQLYNYYTLNQHTPAKTIDWSIVPINDERYQLKAKYQFEINNSTYQDTTILTHPFYRNPWAAEKGLQQIKNQPPPVWYSSKDPTISSLENHFPLKDTIYSTIIWVLMVYFFGLAFYTCQRKKI